MEIGTMRKLRLKNDGEGFYNVGTRCVDRTFRFDDADKTHIVDQIRRMAVFCGIEVNTYAFPKVFNARKMPVEPFMTDIGAQNSTIFASHKPRGYCIISA